jgi:hypothetical protein
MAGKVQHVIFNLADICHSHNYSPSCAIIWGNIDVAGTGKCRLHTIAHMKTELLSSYLGIEDGFRELQPNV